jgi:hypothetical protein
MHHHDHIHETFSSIDRTTPHRKPTLPLQYNPSKNIITAGSTHQKFPIQVPWGFHQHYRSRLEPSKFSHPQALRNTHQKPTLSTTYVHFSPWNPQKSIDSVPSEVCIARHSRFKVINFFPRQVPWAGYLASFPLTPHRFQNHPSGATWFWNDRERQGYTATPSGKTE